jgi:cyanophycinase
VTGPIALHGGGEFLPGDEPFLRALLEVARRSTDRGSAEAPLRVAVVPTAAANHGPSTSARHGVEGFERVAGDLGLAVEAEPVLVVDAASANDPTLAAPLAAAHLVYLPGGDPALVGAALSGSSAWAAIVGAHERGAAIAGASAGAMALAAETWTPVGWRDGLGLVPGLIVVPHFEQFAAEAARRRDEIARLDERRLGRLGLDERTGAIREPDGTWRVAGAGAAHWFAVGADPVVARHGEHLPIPR